jgi:hypothetical protein
MGLLSLTLCDLQLNPIPQEWAIEQVLAATVVMEELDQFSDHSITVSGSFRENLALLNGLTAVRIDDSDLGTIAYGLLIDPEDQITADDTHTITIQLPNITADLLYSTTGQGWVAGYAIPGGISPAPPPRTGQPQSNLTFAGIIDRLGKMRYGWSARVVDYGNYPYALRYEDATILGALMQAAQATFGHVRLAHDASGQPIKQIELGLFGQGPAIEIITPDGGNAQDILTRNPDARLAQTVTRHPADWSKIVTTLTPLGGGTGAQQVRFRRLFRILYDPAYEHFAGNDSRKLSSYFPEWDVNYPIHALLDAQGVVRPARPMKGDSNQFEIAARFDGGADGYEYCMSDQAQLTAMNQKFPHCGEFRAPFTDSTFSYVDSDIYNQEMTERALYISAKAQLQWYSRPAQTITVTTVGNRRPPRAGEKVHFDINRIGLDQRGAYAEVAEQGDYTIVSVVRQYGDVVVDTWTVTSNGKHPPDPTSQDRNATRGMVEALRLIPTTQPAIYSIASGQVFIDASAAHMYVHAWELPSNITRVQQLHVSLQVWGWRRFFSQGANAPSINGVSDGSHQHYVPLGPFTIPAWQLPYHIHNAPVPNHAHGTNIEGDHNHGYINTTHNQGTGISVGGGGNIGDASAPYDHYHSFVVQGEGNKVDVQGGVSKSTSWNNFVFIDPGAPYGLAAQNGQVQAKTSSIQNYAQGNSNHSHGSSTTASGSVTKDGYTDPNNGGQGHGMGNNGGFTWPTVAQAFPNNLTNGQDNSNQNQQTPWISLSTTATQALTDANWPGASGQGGQHLHSYTDALWDAGHQPQVYLDFSPDGQAWYRMGGPFDAGQQQPIDVLALLATTAAPDIKGGTIPLFRIFAVQGSNNPLGLAIVSLSGYAIVELNGVGSQVLYA